MLDFWSTVCRPVHGSGLDGSAVVPAHAHKNADLGDAYYREHTTWANRFGVRDVTGYKKRSKREGYVERTAKYWRLNESCYQHGSTEPCEFSHTVLQCQMLFAWLLDTFRRCSANTPWRMHVVSCLARCYVVAVGGYSLLEVGQSPMIMIGGHNLPMRDGCMVDLSVLFCLCPKRANDCRS